MELKDFNIFNLSLQQKKLLKKKIGSGGFAPYSNITFVEVVQS